MKKLFITLMASICLISNAQNNDCWLIQLTKKNPTGIGKQNFDFNHFEIQKNGAYIFLVSLEQEEILGIIVDIKPNYLYISNYLDSSIAAKQNDEYKIIELPIHQLIGFKLVADRSISIYNKIYLKNYTYQFINDCEFHILESRKGKIYKHDQEESDLIPYLTQQGYDDLSVIDGRMYYYRGPIAKPSGERKIDTAYRKAYVAWLTPSKRDEINGLAIGVLPKNVKNYSLDISELLIIRGVNITINPLSGLIYILNGSIIDYPATTNINYQNSKKNLELLIYGVNISLSGTSAPSRLYGINLSGVVTSVTELHGVSITGLVSFAYKTNGIVISGLENIAKECNGVQIGLFNRADKLRGIQIGLWNRTSQRGLPFINFGF